VDHYSKIQEDNSKLNNWTQEKELNFKKEYEEIHSKKDKEIMELRSEIENLKIEKEKMVELQIEATKSLNEIKKFQEDSKQLTKIRDILNKDSDFILISPKPEQPEQKPEQTQNSYGLDFQ